MSICRVSVPLLGLRVAPPALASAKREALRLAPVVA